MGYHCRILIKSPVFSGEISTDCLENGIHFVMVAMKWALGEYINIFVSFRNYSKSAKSVFVDMEAEFADHSIPVCICVYADTYNEDGTIKSEPPELFYEDVKAAVSAALAK